MTPFEVVALQIAKSIVSAVRRIWVADGTPIGDSSDKAVDALINQAFPSLLEQRVIARNFDATVDVVAERIEPLVSAEFPQLADEQRLPIHRQVAEWLDALRFTGDGLTMLSIEPAAIVGAISSSTEFAHYVSLLSEDEDQYLRIFLAEAAGYVCGIITRLPPLHLSRQARTAELTLEAVKGSKLTQQWSDDQLARAHLRQQDLLADMVAAILDNMPKVSALSAHQDDAVFLADFRRDVVRRLDVMKVPGAQGRQEYRISLSAAYVAPSALTSAIDPHAEPVGLTDLFKGSDKILLIGEAGAGKSTMLQWMAIQAAQERLDIGEQYSRIPFYLPLRRVLLAGMPVEQLTDLAAPTVGGKPPGWLHRILTERRGLLLLDGLDEVSPEHRDETLSWAKSVQDNYPGTLLVISTRPQVSMSRLFAEYGLLRLHIPAMTPPEVDCCIERWHTAAAAGETSEEALKIREMELPLRAKVRESPELLRLATIPLLAAMICSLNRDSETALPRDRAGLYEAAISHLLQRRRHPAQDHRLPLPIVRVALEDFAYWMMVNGRVETSLDSWLASARKTLEHSILEDVTGQDILDWIRTSSGILTEPEVGVVSFVHRSFQEYLAACACVRGDLIGLLVREAQAGRDEWDEVMISATARATNAQRKEILEGLLHRDALPEGLAKRLVILAAACAGASQAAIPAGFSHDLSRALGEIVPLQNEADIAGVTSAGSLAVSQLRFRPGYDERTSALHIQALARIGGPAAQAALGGFAATAKGDSLVALVDAWSFFPAEEYALEVLSQCSWEGHLVLRDPMRQSWLGSIRNRASVRCEYRTASATAVQIAAGKEWVSALDLSGNLTLTQLSVIEGYSSLQVLEARDCPSLTSTELRVDSPLEIVDLSGCERLEDVYLLLHAPRLRALVLDRTGGRYELHPFRRVSKTLEELSMLNLTFHATQLIPLARLEALRRIRLSGTPAQWPDWVSLVPGAQFLG